MLLNTILHRLFFAYADVLGEDQDNVLDLMPNSQYVETWRERDKWEAPSQCRKRN